MPKFSTGNVPLKKRLIMLLAVPMLGLVWANGSTALNARSEANEANDLQTLTELSVATGNFLHETQSERGQTALFLTAAGTSNADLIAQRKDTDAAGEAVQDFLKTNLEILPTPLQEKIATTTEAFNLLDSTRSQVDSRSLEVSEAISSYNELNQALLVLVSEVGKNSSSGEISRSSAAYLALLKGKDGMGVMRAQLSNLFTNSEFAPGQQNSIIGLDSRTNAFFAIFTDEASSPLVAQLGELSQDPVVIATATTIANVVSAEPTVTGVDPDEWFDSMTTTIGLVKNLEDAQSAEIHQIAADLANDANSDFRRSLVMLVAFAAVTSGLALYMIRSITNALGGHASELASTSNQLGTTAAELSKVVGLAAETADQASGAAQEVSGNVSNVATAVEELAQSITEISVNTSRASQVAADAIDKADNTNETVTKLSNSSDEIGAVVEVIASIAEQTNLLALNATIEAARAGESGKGFAVVANEVKELAQQTNSSTEQIGKLVAAIQNDSIQSAHAVQEIGGVIQEIAEIQTSIAAAVEEQSATTGEISRNITQAADGSSEIALSIRAVADQAGEAQTDIATTVQAANSLNDVAGAIQEMAGTDK